MMSIHQDVEEYAPSDNKCLKDLLFVAIWFRLVRISALGRG